MNTNTPCFNIYPGYIVLSRAEYDEIIQQRIANRNDYIDELNAKDKLIDTLKSEHARLTSMRNTAEKNVEYIAKERDEAQAREKETAYKLFQANEQIIALKQELHDLYDELCKSDEIREVNPNAVSETPRNPL